MIKDLRKTMKWPTRDNMFVHWLTDDWKSPGVKCTAQEDENRYWFLESESTPPGTKPSSSVILTQILPAPS